jgi:AcrR family transcriptional regulator
MTQPPNEERARPRKRPKQGRSLETVKVIVEAAARILEARGHGGFSTNAVAERAGVSIGSLYQYFPSKDALIGALIVRETALLLDDVEVAAAQPGSAVAISAFIAACIAHQFRRPALARLLDFEEARLPFDADTARVGDRIQAIVLEILGRPDLMPQPDRPAAARDVIAIVKGMIDAAGRCGETDLVALATRVEKAAFGYLGVVRI